jgi:hypothetical protein
MEELIRKQDAIDAMLGDKVEITNVIRAIGNERDFEVLNCTCDRHAEIIKALPPVQTDYTEMKQEFLRMASYIDVLLECSDKQKETLIGFISRLAEFMPWTERD